MEKKTEHLHIRVSPEFEKKLEDLCKLWDLDKTGVINRLVLLEWQRSTEVGQKEIADMLGKFKDLTDSINSLNASNGK